MTVSKFLLSESVRHFEVLKRQEPNISTLEVQMQALEVLFYSTDLIKLKFLNDRKLTLVKVCG